MITAMPLETNNGTIALELVKFISEKALDNFLNLPQENKKMYRSLARLHDLAFKDALTDIFNRRYIDSQLPQEISQSHHNNEPFSIVMTDIDYFKQVNDQYGHSIGDRVLQYFAAFLQENIDTTNGSWVARYGGEEFLIVLPKCWGQQAYDLTEKIRTAVAAAVISTPAGTIHISASFGVHTFSGQECQHQMIDKADKQLYLAKQAGRNCTMMLSP